MIFVLCTTHYWARCVFKTPNRQFQILNSGGYIYHLIWRKIETPEGLEELHFIPRDDTEIAKLFQSKFEVICIEAFGEFEENDSLAVLARKKD